MTTPINTFQDILDAMERDPALLDTLRRHILTDDLLELPAQVKALTETVQTLAETVKVLSETVAVLTKDVEAIKADLSSLTEKVSSLTDHGAQGAVEPFPGSVFGPAAEVLVHRLPRREVMGQHPPRAAGAQRVQDAVERLPQVHGAGPAPRLGRRQKGRQNFPLGIGQIAGIRFPVHAAI